MGCKTSKIGVDSGSVQSIVKQGATNEYNQSHLQCHTNTSSAVRSKNVEKVLSSSIKHIRDSNLTLDKSKSRSLEVTGTLDATYELSRRPIHGIDDSLQPRLNSKSTQFEIYDLPLQGATSKLEQRDDRELRLKYKSGSEFPQSDTTSTTVHSTKITVKTGDKTTDESNESNESDTYTMRSDKVRHRRRSKEQPKDCCNHAKFLQSKSKRKNSEKSLRPPFCLDLYIPFTDETVVKFLKANDKLTNSSLACKIRLTLNDFIWCGERRKRIRVESFKREQLIECVDLINSLFPEWKVWNNGKVPGIMRLPKGKKPSVPSSTKT